MDHETARIKAQKAEARANKAYKPDEAFNGLESFLSTDDDTGE
jgi:hypothetical protein